MGFALYMAVGEWMKPISKSRGTGRICTAQYMYGKTVDFMVGKKRDATAAKKFFRKAFLTNGLPHRVNIDKSGANTRRHRTYEHD